MIYGGILAGFGASFVAMSLAELASMCVFFGSRSQALFNLSQVIPWSERNTAGQHVSLLLRPGSGLCCKVRYRTLRARVSNANV